MNRIVVGGDFGDQKSSSVIAKLGLYLNANIVNGGGIETICNLVDSLKGYDLVVWAPNINNEVDKNYPKKDSGAVLICSKVLRENRDFGDAIARIFKMNGNAVITIESQEKPFKFSLIDALGNVWCKTTDIGELSFKIEELYKWTKASTRTRSKNIEFTIEELPKTDLTALCGIVKRVADNVENERGGRYFGNVSTRCGKMFPSQRLENDIVLMSGRNVGKSRISEEDFVYTKLVDGCVMCHGEKKPSVDTPIQLNMYEYFKNINYFIHGHAYIDGAAFTQHYYPCGDLRELSAVKEIIHQDSDQIVLNLKNHGFLLGTNNIDQLRALVENLNFKHRQIGIEIADINELKPQI